MHFLLFFVGWDGFGDRFDFRDGCIDVFSDHADLQGCKLHGIDAQDTGH